MRECGVDLLPLQLILGHTPKTITEKVYTHITDQELKDTINRLKYDGVSYL
jgi:integrase